jgi:hypothetical protein
VPNRRACQFIIFLKVCPPNKKIGPFCPFIQATLSMAHLRVGISKMKRIREKKLFFLNKLLTKPFSKLTLEVVNGASQLRAY